MQLATTSLDAASVSLIRDEPVLVSKMLTSADSFEDKFDAALASMLANGNSGKLVLPNGWLDVTRTLTGNYAGTPALSRVLNGVEIVGGRDTSLHWNGPVNTTMFDLPGSYNFSMNKFRIIGRPIAGGPPIVGFIPIVDRPAWEHNSRSNYCRKFEELIFIECDKGPYCGDPLGPDITNVIWENCALLNCNGGFIINGANVTDYVFNSIRMTGAMTTFGWEIIYNSSLRFESQEVRDPWDVPVGQAKYNTDRWNERIIDDSGNNRLHPDFEQNEAKTIGGGAQVRINNANIAIGPSTVGAGEPVIYVIKASGPASLVVDGLRIEGNNAGTLDVDTTVFLPNDRFETILNKVATTLQPAASINRPDINMGAAVGAPLNIRNSHFGGTIPDKQDLAPNHITYSGRVTAAGVTKHANGLDPQVDTIVANVRRYGAVGDGIVDDTAAIQAALADRGTVYAPDGTYKITSALSLLPDQAIFGDNRKQTILNLSGSAVRLNIEDHTIVKDLKVSGDTTQDYGISVTGTAARWLIDNVSINNCISGLGLNNTWIGEIKSPFIRDCTNGVFVHNGLSSDGPVNAINFFGGEIAACTYGVRFSLDGGPGFSVNNFNFYGTAIEPSGTYGVWVEDVGVGTLQFNGVYFEACGEAIYQQDVGVENVSFTHCLLDLDSGASDKGIHVTAGISEALTVQNSTFTRRSGSVATEALVFDSGATVRNPVLLTNTWRDSALVAVDNMANYNIFSIGDERLGTKFPGVDSVSGGTDQNSNNYLGKVTFTSTDTTKAVTIATEDDATYRIDVYGFDWNYGAVWITSQTTTGFTINVETARGSGSREIFWTMTRR